MTIRNILEQDPSRRNIDRVANMILKNPEILNETWCLALDNNISVNWRAAWVVEAVWEQRPELIEPYLKNIYTHLPGFKTDGQKREILKMIAGSSLPENEEELGLLLNYCFERMLDAKESVSVKVYSMDILYNISKIYPEIKPELISSVEHILEEGTPDVKVRGKRILRKLYPECDSNNS